MCGESIVTVKNQCCVFNGNIRFMIDCAQEGGFRKYLSVRMLFYLSLGEPTTVIAAGPTLLKSSLNLILSQN